MRTTVLTASAVLALSIVGCKKTTLEIENASGSDIQVTVPRVNQAKGKTETHTVAKGATMSIPVGAPVMNKTAKVQVEIKGEWVWMSEDVEVTVGAPNPKKVVNNAGFLEVTNATGGALGKIHVAQIKDKSMLVGFGDWGDPHGPIAADSTQKIGPLMEATNYWIKGAGGVKGQYSVKAGEVTPVTLESSKK